MNGDLLRFASGSSPTINGQRDVILAAIDKIFRDAHEKKPFLGWIGLPDEKKALLEIQKWLKQIKKNQDTLAVFGMGGSSLGAKAVYDFLEPEKRVLFFDNVDGFTFEKRIAELILRKTHFLIISKSGETSETLFQLARLLEILDKKKHKFQNHVTVITEARNSTLYRIAHQFDLSLLEVPPDVGGRFSVLSAVGLAPLMWAGIPAKKLLDGAKWARDQRKMIADIAEFYLDSFRRPSSISVFWCYADLLRTFGLWLEQLWAESLGKAKNRKSENAPLASTPLTCIGATDQHSLLQQFTEGTRDKSFMFIRNDQAEKGPRMKKTASPDLSLAKNRSLGDLLAIEAGATEKIIDGIGLAHCRLTLSAYDAKTCGALLFLFELLVATIGECLDINAFDQPGVEDVKKVTLGTLGDSRYREFALDLV